MSTSTESNRLRIFWNIMIPVNIVVMLAGGYAALSFRAQLDQANKNIVTYQGTIGALSDQVVEQHNEIIRLKQKVIDVDPTVHKAVPPKSPRVQNKPEEIPDPSPTGESVAPLTRVEAEKAYGQANACLRGNIAAVKKGSKRFENYPDMRVVEAVALRDEISEAGFYGLSSSLAELYNSYLVLTNESGVPLIDEVVPNKIGTEPPF